VTSRQYRRRYERSRFMRRNASIDYGRSTIDDCQSVVELRGIEPLTS
jgi:hypothetical protein